MKARTSILILVAFLALGGVLLWLRARHEESGAGGAAGGAGSAVSAGSAVAADTARASASGRGATTSAQKVTLPFLFSTEKEEWLREAVGEFAKIHPEIDVQLDGQGSLDAVRSLLAGEKKPVLWSPADSLAVNLLATQWQLARSTDPVVRDGTKWPRPLLLTPLVFVAWDSRAKVLLGKSTDLTWQRLRDAVGSKKGWPGIGGDPAWAFVKFGHTDPQKSNSGLQALVLMAYGFYGRQSALSVADVTAQPFQDFVKALEAGRHTQDFAASSTGPFMQNFIRQGPSLYDVVVAYEALAIADIPRAAGRWEALRVFYPPINLWSDHPVCLLNADWVTPDQRKAADVLVDYLMSPPVQTAALRRGFRPGNVDVPVVTQDPDNPFNRYKDLGVRIDVPRIATPPDGAVLQALMQTFQRNAP